MNSEFNAHDNELPESLFKQIECWAWCTSTRQEKKTKNSCENWITLQKLEKVLETTDDTSTCFWLIYTTNKFIVDSMHTKLGVSLI